MEPPTNNPQYNSRHHLRLLHLRRRLVRIRALPLLLRPPPFLPSSSSSITVIVSAALTWLRLPVPLQLRVPVCFALPAHTCPPVVIAGVAVV